MKIKITQHYTDKQLNKNMNSGDQIDVTSQRGKELIDKGYAIELESEISDIVTTEVQAPVKKTRAKRK